MKVLKTTMPVYDAGTHPDDEGLTWGDEDIGFLEAQQLLRPGPVHTHDEIEKAREAYRRLKDPSRAARQLESSD